MAVRVTVFRADDGSLHDSDADAENHNFRCKLRRCITPWVLQVLEAHDPKTRVAKAVDAAIEDILQVIGDEDWNRKE